MEKFLLVAVGFELKVSNLLGRHSTTSETQPARENFKTAI
jgi:hypothetical protein